MANLKLIKVTGSPFCSSLYGCIGIQIGDNHFQIIKDKMLNLQSSFSGNGWEYVTAEEIAENWKLIYPHWTPEVGDRVIITQDFQDWANSKGTIIEKDGSSDYYRVESETGRSCIFDYTSQMILAPYNETKVESKETTMTKFKEGDRVKCIREGILSYGKVGTALIVGDTSVGVKFDENVNGHGLDGMCSDGYGWWIGLSDLELVTEPKSKKETVRIRFLSEKEFKEKGLWRDTHPKGWNYEGNMNRYLGKVIEIPKSRIESNGSFRYENWKFEATDYIVTEWIPSKVDDFRDVSRTIASSGSISKSVVTPIAKPEILLRTFKVGDKVTYKSRGDSYHYGGDDQEGFVGTVEHTGEYVEDKGCYCLRVTTKEGDFCYNMLESEFHEYDSGYVSITSGAIGSSQPTSRLVIKGSSAAADSKHILVGGIAYPISHYSSDGTTINTVTTPTLPKHVDPLSSYEQKPITIKQKPKSKLTII